MITVRLSKLPCFRGQHPVLYCLAVQDPRPLQVRNPQWRPVNPICKNSCSATAKRLKPKKLEPEPRLVPDAELLPWRRANKCYWFGKIRTWHLWNWVIRLLYERFFTSFFVSFLWYLVMSRLSFHDFAEEQRRKKKHTFKSQSRGPGKRLKGRAFCSKKVHSKKCNFHGLNGFWSFKTRLFLDWYIFANRKWINGKNFHVFLIAPLN